MITKEKLRNQVKSKFYYIFWGVATATVLLGQIYVVLDIEYLPILYLEYLMLLKFRLMMIMKGFINGTI